MIPEPKLNGKKSKISGDAPIIAFIGLSRPSARSWTRMVSRYMLRTTLVGAPLSDVIKKLNSLPMEHITERLAILADLVESFIVILFSDYFVLTYT